MEQFVNPDLIRSLWENALAWVEHNVLVLSNLVQAVVVAVCLLFARFCGPRARAAEQRWRDARARTTLFARGVDALAVMSVPVIWMLLLWVAVAVAAHSSWPHHLITIGGSLLSAWIVIHLTSRMIRNPAWAQFIAASAWAVAALSVLGLLEPTIEILDKLAISFGSLRVSALAVIKGVAALALLLWIALGASAILERRINASPNLTPSVQVLFGKLTKIVLIVLAVLISLDSVGIDLTALAVFSGALGVGIGFGLQRIIANLVSGVILLLDKSIKPGDVIGVAGTYGWIESLGARYASVVTRDGTEHLIPNEELITQRVENWSHRDQFVRLKMPIGISYRSDPRQAIKLCLEAAAAVKRIVEQPEPRCLVKGFGDSSVDLELRIWITDPQNGITNVRSEAYLLIWDKFHEHGVEIPYPQRDLHIRSPEIIRVGPGAEPSAA